MPGNAAARRTLLACQNYLSTAKRQYCSCASLEHETAGPATARALIELPAARKFLAMSITVGNLSWHLLSFR
jgi:hypothetical protein